MNNVLLYGQIAVGMSLLKCDMCRNEIYVGETGMVDVLICNLEQHYLCRSCYNRLLVSQGLSPVALHHVSRRDRRKAQHQAEREQRHQRRLARRVNRGQ